MKLKREIPMFADARTRRLLHFLLLAVTMAALYTLAITLAESLFLANLGSDKLPLFYLLLAAVSTPASALLASLIDRFAKPRLFRHFLSFTALLTLVLYWFSGFGSAWVLYTVYVSYSVIELLLLVQFWVLVSDFFTSLELKHYAVHIVAAMAVGGLLGGGAANLLSRYMTARTLLLGVAVLCVAALLQLFHLESSQKELPVGDGDEKHEAGVVESLKTLPQMMRGHPVIFYLMSSTFLLVMVQCVTEYQVFRIYSNAFPSEEALTKFLGTVNAGLSVAEFVVIYYFSRPLIERLGVRRMNLAHPLTALLSFAGLAVSSRLPFAIFANANYRTFGEGIAQPVEAISFNAVPQRFLGRVRVLCEGMIYPAGLALSGVFLMFTVGRLTPMQFTQIGIVLSLIYVVVGYMLGEGYVKSLVAMIRSRTLNLDDMEEGLQDLSGYSGEVRDLLASQDHEEQILGIEMASRVDPAQFMEAVESSIARTGIPARQPMLNLYAALSKRNLISHVRSRLDSPREEIRTAALESLVICRVVLSEEKLQSLLHDPSPDVRILACLSALQACDAGSELRASCEGVLNSELTEKAQLLLVSAIEGSRDRQFMPLLERLLTLKVLPLRRAVLSALVRLAQPGDTHLAKTVGTELQDKDNDPNVRIEVCKLLGIARSDEAMGLLQAAMQDPSYTVRQAAAIALARYGEASLGICEALLTSMVPESVDAAIFTLGHLHIRRGEESLLRYLATESQQASANLRWMKALPPEETGSPIQVGIADSNQRIVSRLLLVLESLGQSKALRCIRQVLYSRDERMRANAVETLLSQSRRRFVEPFLPLLEHQALSSSHTGRSNNNHKSHLDVLQEASRCSDRWIRVAAIQMLDQSGHSVPPSLLADRDPVVRAAAEQVSQCHLNSHLNKQANGEYFMNRLIFLKKVPLFSYLSLDDLLLLQDVLTVDHYVAGELVFPEGAIGRNFYIVQEGSIRISKGPDGAKHDLATLGPGDCFGEMSLFDEEPRSAAAMALVDSTLLNLDKDRFLSMISQRPQIALQICKVLSMRLRETDRWAATQSPLPHDRSVSSGSANAAD